MDYEIAAPGETFAPSAPSAPAEVGKRKVDAFRGTMSGVLSSQWSSRPDDQRFLSLDDLHDAVKARADTSRADVIDLSKVRMDVGDGSDMRFQDDHGMVEFENWSFGQTCKLLSQPGKPIPAGYLRNLPPTLAAVNLQYAVQTFRSELVKSYRQDIGGEVGILRAMTGPDYGRITDAEVVASMKMLADDGLGWKVPGCMDWSTGSYDPDAPVTKDSTTLYASDRDVWLFLCDDKHPIEIGKLPDGSPDYVFRGAMAWNSEVGSKSYGMASWYLRGICQNRCMWGIEGFEEITWRHSSRAPDRFVREARPALEKFAQGATGKLLGGVAAAKAAVVASNEEERLAFLQNLKFSKQASVDILETVTREEGHPARSIWDMVQGITAKARDIAHTDDRVTMERLAGKLLDKVA